MFASTFSFMHVPADHRERKEIEREAEGKEETHTHTLTLTRGRARACALTNMQILQIIQADSSFGHFLWRKWGRIGTSQGGNKLMQCSQVCVSLSVFDL